MCTKQDPLIDDAEDRMQIAKALFTSRSTTSTTFQSNVLVKIVRRLVICNVNTGVLALVCAQNSLYDFPREQA